jgi:hypothetical protein
MYASGGVGDNNTNICAPVLPTASDSQVQTAIKELKKHPQLAGRNVSIQWKATAEGGDVLTTQIQSILAGDGITATIGTSQLAFITPGVASLPGLSFTFVVQGNKDLADAIEKSLRIAKIISSPLKPRKRDLPYAPQNLVIAIRNCHR